MNKEQINLLDSMGVTPEEYIESAVVAREAGEELLSRLDWMTLKPSVVLDVGHVTEESRRLLQQRYPDARVLLEADSKEPLSAQSVDLIFANFYLPWQADIKPLLKEWRRMLRPDGLLMLTTLGPDTLKEYHADFAGHIIPGWQDMHDLGDLLLEIGFSDPVLDACPYSLVYREPDKLIHELVASGMLVSPSAPLAVSPMENGEYELTYEVIFAHAFCPSSSQLSRADEDGVVKVPVSHLKR